MDGVQAPPGTAFGLGGAPEVLTVAADQLRADIARGGYRTHPPGEYPMYAVARLLDSLAGSLRRGQPLRHPVTKLCTAYVPGIPTSANAPVLVALAELVTLLWGPTTLSWIRLSDRARRSTSPRSEGRADTRRLHPSAS